MGLGKRAGIEGIDQGRGSGLSSSCGKKGGKRYVNLQQILARGDEPCGRTVPEAIPEFDPDSRATAGRLVWAIKDTVVVEGTVDQEGATLQS